MARTYKSQEVINGTFGHLWVNGEIVAEVKSFQVKLDLTWEEVSMADRLTPGRKLIGADISGELTLHKVDSKFQKMYKNAINGEVPDIEFIGAVEDPQAKGAERIMLEEVIFTSLDLMKYEMKTLTEQSLPFNAANYDYLDMIA